MSVKCWGAETGKGREPTKGVLLGRLPLWAAEVRSPPGDLWEGVSDGLGTAPPEGQGKRVIGS